MTGASNFLGVVVLVGHTEAAAAGAMRAYRISPLLDDDFPRWQRRLLS